MKMFEFRHNLPRSVSIQNALLFCQSRCSLSSVGAECQVLGHVQKFTPVSTNHFQPVSTEIDKAQASSYNGIADLASKRPWETECKFCRPHSSLICKVAR